MFRELFKNKKFIFLFTFIVESIFFYIFEHTFITGEFIVADIGLAPVLGLMFGPVGGLGHAFATLTWEIFEGVDLITSLMDFTLMFFISILPYKLWYTISNNKEFDTPRFDSIDNLLKFLFIMFLVSIIYLALLEISFDIYPKFYLVYPLKSSTIRVSYILNNFTFSIMFGLFFISAFNTLKIPLRIPKKWITKIKIDYKYFAIPFILIIVYFYLNIFNIINNHLINELFFTAIIIVSVIFCLNTRDTEIKPKENNFSIIEQIILIFLVILSIMIMFNFEYMEMLSYFILKGFSPSYRFLIMVTISTVVIILFSIIHLHYIEKIITNPIYELINETNKYLPTKNAKLNNKLKEYSEKNDDVGLLVKSFIRLSRNIKDNLDKIEKTTAEKERFETEFNVASKIQSDMLHKDFEEFSQNKPFEIYAYIKPARKVGWDFYDYFTTDEDNMNFVIGDVEGHGIPSTLFMIKTMHLIKNYSKIDDDLSQVFENVNNLACERNKEELHVTTWIGKLNLKSGKLSFVNAEHKAPLICQNNGDFEYLKTRANLAIGKSAGISYEQHELELNAGDVIFLYTDGLTDAQDNNQKQYGEDRLKETINRLKHEKLSKIISEIKNDIDEFCNNHENDDMTMLIMKYNGCDEE